MRRGGFLKIVPTARNFCTSGDENRRKWRNGRGGDFDAVVSVRCPDSPYP